MLTNKTVMGLTRNAVTRRVQVDQNDRVYFSDLSGADLSGLDLSTKRFFGCVLSGCDLHGSVLAGCRFENCFVEQDLLPSLDGASIENLSIENSNFTLADTPSRVSLEWNVWTDEVVGVVRPALRGQPNPLFAAIREQLSSDDSSDMSAMLSLCAVELGSSTWEYRQASLSILSSALLRASKLMDPMRDAYLALLLYRTGDSSDMVYYQALDLLDTFAPDDSVLAPVLGRIESPEASERKEALIGARRILTRYPCDTVFPDDALVRMLANPEQPPDVAREALRTLAERLDSLAVDEDAFQARLTPALTRLLEHDDEQIRRETLRVVGHFYSWQYRTRIHNLLRDQSDDIRARAFMTLYRITPADELLKLLKEHPPPASCHADIVAHQIYLRENDWSNSLISDEELRPLLTSDDVDARKDGLYYASFLGDNRYRSQLMASLEHSHPEVRIAALRAIEWLDPPPTRDELQFLERDPDDAVRSEHANLLAARGARTTNS